jgi:outer membrane protein OmpA-like peptidoglycan-associated protein
MIQFDIVDRVSTPVKELMNLRKTRSRFESFNRSARKWGLLSLSTSFLFSAISMANVVGTETQNFNPTYNGLDFVTVQSSETLKPGIVNFGAFWNYAVNSLPYYDGGTQSRSNFSDSLTSLDLSVGLGLTQDWDVGISMPQLLSQTVKDSSGFTRGEFSQSGSTELRLASKYRLMGDNDNGGLALVGTINQNRIKNNPYSGEEAGPTYNLELAWDRVTQSSIAYGFNLGHRWRSPGKAIATFPVEPFANQIIASTAASYLFSKIDTKIIFELFGSWPTQSRGNAAQDRAQSSLEALLGAKHDLTDALAIHGGVGTEVIQGAGSPDLRLYAGLHYAFGPLWGRESEATVEKYVAPPKPIEIDTSVGDNIKLKCQEILIARNIRFLTGKNTPDSASQKVIAEVADRLAKISPLNNVRIDGHTDSVGSEELNDRLSLARATSIKGILVKQHQFKEDLLIPTGYGERNPIADNGNFQGRAANRRVEFRINCEKVQLTAPPVQEPASTETP